jgi:hypothetical protein
MMMRKEVKILRSKAIESLVLSIELFNRPSETGRAHGVLIFLDHAFEMLLKGITSCIAAVESASLGPLRQLALTPV